MDHLIRQFAWLLIDPNSARICMYTTTNPYKLGASFSVIQDCKHVFKKSGIPFYQVLQLENGKLC